MFNTIFSDEVSTWLVLLMGLLSVVFGLVISLITSIKLKASKSFLVTIVLLPLIVSYAFFFINIMLKKDTTIAITSIGSVMIGMGLLRFRSLPAKAEEILLIFLAVIVGVLNGLGYLMYSFILSGSVSLLYLLFMAINPRIFKNKNQEKLLKITIPESLEYEEMFNEVFSNYLKEYDLVGVKTTGMGSMYKLSYRITMKNMMKDKQLIDELRIMNGNLEISIVPYVEDREAL